MPSLLRTTELNVSPNPREIAKAIIQEMELDNGSLGIFNISKESLDACQQGIEQMKAVNEALNSIF